MAEPQFDYVIVGAGAAGCVLANRLSEDGAATVCVLEAGRNDSHPFIAIPAGFVKTLYGDRFVWPFKTEPSASLDGRSIALPQGRVVGGSSSINGMVYNRGQRADFDVWAQMGNRGWGFDDLLPYFNRSETRLSDGDAPHRGQTGELPITDIDWINPLADLITLVSPPTPVAAAVLNDGSGRYVSRRPSAPLLDQPIEPTRYIPRQL